MNEYDASLDDPDGIVNEMAALGIVTRHYRREDISKNCYCAYCVHYPQ